jgi:hypothetical protein
MKQYRLSFLLFSPSLFFAVFLNEWNLSVMRNAGIPLRNNTTIITADDASYLSPMNRLYEHGSICTNETEKWTSIVRSPGYGLLYYGCLLVLGPENALLGLKWMQYLLFGLSIPALFFVLHHVLNNQRMAFIGAMLYGCLPFSYGFLAHTLTEAVTPAFLIFTYYFLTKAMVSNKNTFKWWIFAAGMGGWLVLTRPALGLFLIPLLFFMWNAHQSKLLRLAMLFVVILLPVGIWQIRHKIVLGSFQSLHPIYQHQVPGMYRLPHESFWHLVKSWEHKSERFHALTAIIWGKTNSGASAHEITASVIAQLPENAKKTLTQADWLDYIKLLQPAIHASKREDCIGQHPCDEEIAAANMAYSLARKHRAANKLDFAAFTPAMVFKELAFHSNLPYYSIQGKYRGLWWVETLRWLSFVLHSLTISALLIIPMYGLMRGRRTFSLLKSSPPLLMGGILIITSACYIGYLMFVQRGVEERYTLPVLWIGWMALLISTNWIKNKRPFDFHQQKKFL